MEIKTKMFETRLAQKGETARQKEIWKLCFGDPVSFIDFYYANRYKEDETAVLLHDGEIAAMLTMIPVTTVTSDQRSVSTTMLYGIATHPAYQHKGFATQLMDFSNQYLKERKNELSVLVPANTKLFDYYRKQGYQDGFYIREALLTQEKIERLPMGRSCQCTISPITPEEYNHRRKSQLSGRVYISYHDEDIAYQKRLSQLSGAEIYALDMEDVEGCLTVERISSDKVLIKELLLPEEYSYSVIKQIAQQLSAQDFVLRTPPYLGEKFGGLIRPFGMTRVLKESGWVMTSEDLSYLGFAFD